VLGLLSLVGVGWGWMWRVLTAVVDEPDFSAIVVLLVPIGLGQIGVALWAAWRLIAPQQLQSPADRRPRPTAGHQPNEPAAARPPS
jgi:hypothetical protein